MSYRSAELFIIPPQDGVICCPHCGHENTNWLSNPCGNNVECFECDNEFHVPKDIEIRIMGNT